MQKLFPKLARGQYLSTFGWLGPSIEPKVSVLGLQEASSDAQWTVQEDKNQKKI